MVKTECLVPEFTNGELFDCCGSDGLVATCHAFGTFFGAILVGVVFTLIYLNITNEWFRNNGILSFTVFWQIMPALMRTWFYGFAAHAGTSADTYIIVRPSD